MGRVIAISNQKGGVAKTTTAVSLGAALAELGQRVLLLDLDPQGSLTLSCGYQPDDLESSIYQALMKGVDARQVLLRTGFGPDLLPANIDLSMAEIELVNMVARERRIGAVLASLRDDYDFVLIDCQPSLGLLTLNALAVADEVIIPVACEFLSLRGVDVLVKMIGKVRLRLNSKLRILGLLPTLYDPRTNHSKRCLEEIRAHFGAEYRIFDAVVHRSVRFQEAAAAGRPIFALAPDVPGALAYRALARHVLTEPRTSPVAMARG